MYGRFGHHNYGSQNVLQIVTMEIVHARLVETDHVGTRRVDACATWEAIFKYFIAMRYLAYVVWLLRIGPYEPHPIIRIHIQNIRFEFLVAYFDFVVLGRNNW